MDLGTRPVNSLQEELTKPTVLALYNPRAPTKVSADTSSHGLGTVLLQQIDGSWRPVSFASCSMSETEQRYAQIEKEALATTWACEKFANFLPGKHFLIKTDHKPLVPLLGVKHFDTLPPQSSTLQITSRSLQLRHQTCARQRALHSRLTIASPTPQQCPPQQHQLARFG